MSSISPGADVATVFGVPAEVGAVVSEFRSCEFSTLARDGTPVTWPGRARRRGGAGLAPLPFP